MPQGKPCPKLDGESTVGKKRPELIAGKYEEEEKQEEEKSKL